MSKYMDGHFFKALEKRELKRLMKKAKAKKEKQERVLGQVEEASQRWIRKSSLLNVD